MSIALEQTIFEANQQYGSTYGNPDFHVQPRNKLVIAAYGFRLGDTTVVRNAGASGVEGARSALLTCHVLGAENIFVVKHTKCGLLGVTNEFAREVVKKNLGITQSEAVDSLDIISITNLEQSAKDDVEYLRKHPLAIKHVRVTGWIHDTDTGLLTKVVE